MKKRSGITLIWLFVVVFLVTAILIAFGQFNKWQRYWNYRNRIITFNSILGNNYPFYYMNSFENNMSGQNWQIMDNYLRAYDATSQVKTVFLWIEDLFGTDPNEFINSLNCQLMISKPSQNAVLLNFNVKEQVFIARFVGTDILSGKTVDIIKRLDLDFVSIDKLIKTNKVTEVFDRINNSAKPILENFGWLKKKSEETEQPNK